MKARCCSSQGLGLEGGAGAGAGATATWGGPKKAETRRLPMAKPAPSFIAWPKDVLEETEIGWGEGATCADEVRVGTGALAGGELLELEEVRGIPAWAAEK
jgi:hypothetical protein